MCRVELRYSPPSGVSCSKKAKTYPANFDEGENSRTPMVQATLLIRHSLCSRANSVRLLFQASCTSPESKDLRIREEAILESFMKTRNDDRASVCCTARHSVPVCSRCGLNPMLGNSHVGTRQVHRSATRLANGSRHQSAC